MKKNRCYFCGDWEKPSDYFKWSYFCQICKMKPGIESVVSSYNSTDNYNKVLRVWMDMKNTYRFYLDMEYDVTHLVNDYYSPIKIFPGFPFNPDNAAQKLQTI